MTNATVKPALNRIEKKLEEINKVMNKLSTKTKNETENGANPGPTVEKLECECENIEVVQEPQQESKKNLVKAKSE